MKLIITTLMLLGAAFAYCGEAEAPKVSDPAITTYEKAISDIDTKALVEKRKARDVAVKALDAAIKKAMAANDLDKAVALKGAKEKIGGEWKEKGAIGEVNPIVGKWIIVSEKHNNVMIEINNDGSALWGSTLLGNWSVTENIIIVNWSNGIKYSITKDKNSFQFEELSKSGQSISKGTLQNGK